MPELPEVETITRGLDKSLAGHRIEKVTVLNPAPLRQEQAEFISRVRGRTLQKFFRRAKLAIADLDGMLLAFHLKMTGKLMADHMPDDKKHLHLLFELDHGHTLTYEDMRKFGYSLALRPEELPTWSFYNNLGPEPLEITEAEFAGLFTGRKASIKSLILNQSVIAGIGNIYADEALFRSGIHPCAKPVDLSTEQLRNLGHELKLVLEQAIRENGSSIRDYRDSGGNAGSFQNSFFAYGKKGQNCPRCGKTFETAKVAGRTSTFCPCCQRKRVGSL